MRKVALHDGAAGASASEMVERLRRALGIPPEETERTLREIRALVV